MAMRSDNQAIADLKAAGLWYSVIQENQFGCQATRKKPSLEIGEVFTVEHDEIADLNKRSELTGLLARGCLEAFKTKKDAVAHAENLVAEIVKKEAAAKNLEDIKNATKDKQTEQLVGLMSHLTEVVEKLGDKTESQGELIKNLTEKLLAKDNKKPTKKELAAAAAADEVEEEEDGVVS